MVRISIKPNKPGFYLIFDVTKVYQPDRLLEKQRDSREQFSLEFWKRLGLDINISLSQSLKAYLTKGSPDILSAAYRWQTHLDVCSVYEGNPDLYLELLSQDNLIDYKPSLEIIFCSFEIDEEKYSNDKIEDRYPGIQTKARDMLIQLRKNIESGSYTDKIESFLIPCSANIVGTLDSVWNALKQLLMAFRKLRTPSVNASLGYLQNKADEEKLDNIGTLIARTVLQCFQLAKLKGELEDLRRAFAIDLSKKLDITKKNRASNTKIALPLHDEHGFDLSLIEPDPVWRFAIIRGFLDLGIKMRDRNNPNHAILTKVVENDPSDKVRKTAELVYKDINRLRTPMKKGSSWQMIHQAWWWLRYAHRHTLNLEYDRSGAEKLRTNEFR